MANQLNPTIRNYMHENISERISTKAVQIDRFVRLVKKYRDFDELTTPEYRAKMEEKERMALEREHKRQERSTRKKKATLAELKEQAENEPEYAKYLEERNAEYNRSHAARRKAKLEALKSMAEAREPEAQSQLEEYRQYQVRATVKSYRKMRDDALNGDSIAKERYEKTLAKRREAYHAKKNEQSA